MKNVSLCHCILLIKIADDGLVIPCISYEAREQLFVKAASYGYTEQRRIDIISRNICDMVFQLIGGSTRWVQDRA